MDLSGMGLFCVWSMHRQIRQSNGQNIPGGVPQHIVRSSTWSTSKPINHDPRETSSLAYLCSMGLQIEQIVCVLAAW